MTSRWNDWAFADMERTLAEFDALRSEMNRLFDGSPRRRGLAPTRSSWPSITMADRGAELVVHTDLPGVKESDLEISIDQGLLSLKGKRSLDAPEGYSVHRQERQAFQFARSFTLPCRIDPEKTTATLQHGVLTLVLPKAPEDQPRQITVRAS